MKRNDVLCAVLLLIGSCTLCVAQPKIITHRGFWDKLGAAQNSIASLENAIKMGGVHGSEFDVWITKDSVPVLNHDAAYQGVVIEKATFAELSALRLVNGEPLPTLQQYIETAKKQQQTKLIVEIKSHTTPEREWAAVRIITKAIDDAQMTDRADYIAFSANVCEALIAANPQHRVAYLSGDKTPAQLKAEGYWGLDYNQKVLKAHPEWIAEAHALGLTVNVWTVNDVDNMHYFIAHGVDFITTDNPQLLKGILNGSK